MGRSGGGKPGAGGGGGGPLVPGPGPGQGQRQPGTTARHAQNPPSF